MNKLKKLYIHFSDRNRPDRILEPFDYDSSLNQEYKDRCFVYYSAHYVLDLEYQYRGDIDLIEKDLKHEREKKGQLIESLENCSEYATVDDCNGEAGKIARDALMNLQIQKGENKC